MMPCYQSTSLPSGVTTTGRTGYATEAECLQACKEGACCEGTTCSVKPQCQCKCAINSCCGPDIVTVFGITGPACRGGTEAECAARGGVWRPCRGCLADANLPNSPYPCQPSDVLPTNVPVFNGVGTTCAQFNGACCENGACSVKPECECQGTGKTFKGVGTTCNGNLCGCCCVNGTSTGSTEQECAAAGGTWKTYSCGSPPPATVPLTLNFTDYTWNSARFNFSCVRGTYLLQCCTGYAPNPGYSVALSGAWSRLGVAAFEMDTTGSFPPSGVTRQPLACGCAMVKIRTGTVRIHPDAVIEGSSYSCQPTALLTSSQYLQYGLLPYGSTYLNSWEADVPGFCSGQYSVSGVIQGSRVGEIAGTFTFGNPLP